MSQPLPEPVHLPSARAAVMGILNVTPDSFSDGGRHLDPRTAIEAGTRMIEEGADLIDVGGESTRPGASPVSVGEELRRVVPVVEGLAREGIVVSVDTMKAEVARAALAAGARIVNDVSSFADPMMAETCATAGATVCLMHMQGSPQTMQSAPRYDDVVSEVQNFLAVKAMEAVKAGIPSDRLWIDPGIGFGKTVEHNLELIKNLAVFVKMDLPVLLGVSRKSFIGKLLGSAGEAVPVSQRLEGSLAVEIYAQLQGVRIIRTHEPGPTRRALQIAAALGLPPNS